MGVGDTWKNGVPAAAASSRIGWNGSVVPLGSGAGAEGVDGVGAGWVDDGGGEAGCAGVAGGAVVAGGVVAGGVVAGGVVAGGVVTAGPVARGDVLGGTHGGSASQFGLVWLRGSAGGTSAGAGEPGSADAGGTTVVPVPSGNGT